VPVVGAIEAELKRSRHAPSKTCSSDILVIRTNKKEKKTFLQQKAAQKANKPLAAVYESY
jgi:hypothetical protein